MPNTLSKSLDTDVIHFPQDLLQSWQSIIDNVAAIFQVPAALIMKVDRPFIEVFLSSNTDGNPYVIGEREELPGLYCNYVISNNSELFVHNAIKIDEWNNNPDIKLDMINYLGYPLSWPNGSIFGTICILDTKERQYVRIYHDLLMNFRDLIDSHLNLLYSNEILQKQRDKLENQLIRIEKLESLLLVCARCKNIQNKNGNWIKLEEYYQSKTGVKISHSLCHSCVKKTYPSLKI